MYGYIYKTTNLVNGKIYIGQKKSEKFLDRGYLGSGKYLYNALNKYGRENFCVELLEECDTKEILDEREKYYIQYYRNLNCAMYNIANGGEGGDVISGLSDEDKLLRKLKLRENGYFSNLTPEQIKTMHNKAWETRRKNGNDKFSEEYRKKLSDAHKGIKPTKEQLAKMVATRKAKGYKHSDETKRRLSESNKGKRHNISKSIHNRLSECAKARVGEKNPFYGKTHSDETKVHIGEKSKEWYSKNKVIWINDGKTNTRIPEERFLEYQNKGYKKGRIRWANH